MEREKIAAVIVTYNRLEKLKKAIASILDQDIDYVVVLNNKSTDDTQDWLESEALKDSRLKVLYLEENTGGAGGFHYGSKWACENTDAGWLVLFDDDAYPQEELIERFRAKLDKLRKMPDPHQIEPLSEKGGRFEPHKFRSLGAISTAVRTPDGVIADFNRPGVNPFKSIGGFIKYLYSLFAFGGPYLSYEDLENSTHGIHVDYSSFVGFFVKTEVIKSQLGYPRKEFFIYSDDWLYSLELSKLGYKNLYFSDLLFYHDSNTFIASYDDQLWKQYYAFRNSVLFYKRASGWFFPIVLGLKFVKWIFESHRYKKKAEYFDTLFRALEDGLNFESFVEKNKDKFKELEPRLFKPEQEKLASS